jgi:hypothetical protein
MEQRGTLMVVIRRHAMTAASGRTAIVPCGQQMQRRAKNKMRHCASLTTQSQLLHCHAYDTVRAASPSKVSIGKL